MGSGAVGGHMIDGEATAIQMVSAAMDYLHHHRFQDSYNTIQTIIDWEAAKRYGITTTKIPQEARLINKPLSLLEAYHKELISIAIFIVMVLVLGVAWLKKLTELNAKLLDEKNRAESVARKDVLTGMHNRLAFYERTDQACNEATRLEKPVSIVLLDIDHFKKINDNYGHFAGDEVIRKVAKIIGSCKRDIDISARFGGEEFVILLPFSDVTGGENLAKRIIQECEMEMLEYEANSIQFTISAGVSCNTVLSNKCSIDNVIKNADIALYNAKESGRNRVCIYCD